MTQINFKWTDLKDYNKYLIDQYEKIRFGEGGRLMSELKSFYEGGSIKDLLNNNYPDVSKVDELNNFRDRILFFAKSRNIRVYFFDFYEFLNNRNKQ